MHTTTINVITGEIIQIPYTEQEQVEWDNKHAAYLADADNRNAIAIRKERNSKLAATDWTQTIDVPQSIKDKYAPHRQALRDVPAQSGFPNNVDWPTQPQ